MSGPVIAHTILQTMLSAVAIAVAVFVWPSWGAVFPLIAASVCIGFMVKAIVEERA